MGKSALASGSFDALALLDADIKSGSSRTRSVVRSGPSRRSALATGAAAAALYGFPYMSRASAAQSLKFWQIYAPGRDGAAKWFEDVAKGWNDTHDVKVELVYVPSNAYMEGSKLPTAFASGGGRTSPSSVKGISSATIMAACCWI